MTSSTVYGALLADLAARSAVTDRLAAEALADFRDATADAVAAADSMLHAIATAPAPEVVE